MTFEGMSVPMNEKVLITGASAGIGAATARAFAKLGHALVLVARRKDKLETLANELGAHAVMLDVSDAAAVEKAAGAFSGVTVLVNNAGLAAGVAPAQTASMSDWQTMLDTNIKGVLHMTHAVLPKMLEQGRGHIVNLGSVAGTYPYAGGNVYAASKAFLHQLTLAMRSDLLGTPVRMTSIEPGMVETEFSEVRFGGDKEKAKAVYAGMKPLSPEDIAETIVWSVSRPSHVNINVIEVMPVSQAFAGFSVDRRANS
jgi:3-hydroxy acid dehydrogenase / malonic semialdehyde reductase